MKFRKLMIAKKPWEKDASSEIKNSDPKVAMDEFGDESDDDEEYEYYKDSFLQRTSSVDDWEGGKMNSVDNRMSKINRTSTMAGFKQSSLYFDHQISSRMMGSKKKAPPSNYRVSIGIVPAGPPPPFRPKPRTASGGTTITASRGRTPTRLAKSPSLPPMQEASEEEDEKESSEEMENPMNRSLSPRHKKATDNHRSRMTRSNSWTSNRDLLEVKPKKKKSKKKKGSSGDSKKKKHSRSRSGSLTRKDKSTNSKSQRSGGMVRRNSWTSKRDMNADGDKNVRSMSLERGGSETVSEGKKKLKGSKKSDSKKKLKQKDHNKSTDSLSSTKSKTNKTIDKDKDNEPELNSLLSAPKISTTRGGKNRQQIMQGLKKTKDFCTSMAQVINSNGSDEFKKQSADKLQKELVKALDQVVQLNQEAELERENMSKTNTELAEMRMMLAESARENNDLFEKLEAAERKTSEHSFIVDNLQSNVDYLREEKQALATNLNRTDQEMKSLIAQMKMMEGKSSVAADNGCWSEIFELRKSVNEKLSKIEEQAKELEEKDSTIQDLQQKLIDGSSGEDTKQSLELNADLVVLKKQHRKQNLESSVQLAKKDAMIAALQDQLDDARDSNDQETSELKDTKEEFEITKERLQLALKEIEHSQGLRKALEEMQTRVTDAETVEQGLHDAIDKWTDKTFEWKSKAEDLEQELAAMRGEDSGVPGTGNTTKSGFFGFG